MLAAPLIWITAARPLSDVPGLAVALLVQSMILRVSTAPQMLIAACAAGLGAGIRSQVVWLTVPLLLWQVVWNPELRRARTASALAAAYGGGVLLWAVPLLALSGGPRAYWDAIAFQGRADLSGVTMLWTTPTPRQLLAVVEHGFLAPWGWWPLAFSVLLFVAVGGVQADRPQPRLLARWRRPLVRISCSTCCSRRRSPRATRCRWSCRWRSSRRLASSRWRPGTACGSSAGCRLSLAVGQGTLVALAGADAPAFRMLADMRAAAAGRPAAPVLAVHRRHDFDLRRPFDGLPIGRRPFRTSPGAAATRVAGAGQVLERGRPRTGLVCRRSPPQRPRPRPPRRPQASYRWPLAFAR